MAEQAEYSRDGESVAIQMTFCEPMAFSTCNAVGLIHRRDLVLFGHEIIPLVSDRIVRGNLDYEVAAPSLGFSHFGYQDIEKSVIRVHLKQLNK